VEQVFLDNDEAIRAWNGPLFDRFERFRHLIVKSLARHGAAALDRHPPPAGGRVIDIGCGFGDSTCDIAQRVGPDGWALGVDAAERFIAAARSEAEAAGVANARFEVADVELTTFDEQFDHAFSRFGTMFFASPVAALRNVRRALVPGGRLSMVVWRRKLDNPGMHGPELAVKSFLDKPDDSEEPTCGPGPFSMANADTVCDILLGAGYTDIGLERSDIPMMIGRDMDEALDFTMSLGPGAEVLRLLGERADAERPRVAEAIRGALAEYDSPDGIYAPSSTWIVTATAPATAD
jgi:SAM-dependent methyltransferase